MANSFERFPYQPGMRLILRKPHPCGGRIWRLERIGADARLICETCGRSLMMPRRALEKATRSICPQPDGGDTGARLSTSEQSTEGGSGQL